MFWHILKKDMMKRKSVNFILFLFITLSTIFLASSANNIMVVSSAIDYYMDYANIPDITIILNSEENKTKIDQWLLQQQENKKIKDHEYEYFLEISSQSIFINKDHKKEKLKLLEDSGTTLFLSTQKAEYCQVFDENGDSFQLENGEIALPVMMMKKADLHIGDKIIIETSKIKKELIIKESIKDAAFGNEMSGTTRFILNQDDFHDFEKSSYKVGLYYVETANVDEFVSDFNNQGFVGIMQTISLDTYKLVYSLDMIIASLLIFIGICLIMIALLVLRFTLVFSIEEQYQEIGILKAIGLRDSFIKKIYLMKYFVITIIGATLGIALSIPISQMMIKSVSVNMIMASDQINIIIDLLCLLFVISLVLSFCFICTRRLHKVSAITAIRGGYTGERFHNQSKIRLYKCSHLPVVSYLGMNDILSHMKRYIILVIAFCVSFILITIPLNTINTMRSEEMLNKFMLDPQSLAYIRKVESQNEQVFHKAEDLKEKLRSIEEEMSQKGYQAKLSVEPIYFIKYADSKINKESNIMTIQLIEGKQLGDYEEGKAPVLENEIAFSKDIMEDNSWSIGDSIHAMINGQKKKLIITGTYTDYMQLGKSARLNPIMNCDQEIMFDYWAIMVDLNHETKIESLQKDFPQYEWVNGQQIIDEQIGGIQDTLETMLIPMTLMLCAVIMLITLLMEKLFITREKGEIAMMKSIGFKFKTICQWQILRMIFVVVISMIISIPLSLLSNQLILKPIFSIMGASLTIQVDPIDAYLVYPGILLVGIILATTLATYNIKDINIRTMNNLE